MKVAAFLPHLQTVQVYERRDLRFRGRRLLPDELDG